MLETQQKKSIDIREYLQIFRRRKYFFIIPLLISIITGIIISIVLKPVYQSMTVVQVSQGQQLSRTMQKLVPGITPQERLNNLRRLITSHTYLKRLIGMLNLHSDPEMRKIAKKNQEQFPDLTLDEITELFWIEYFRDHIFIRQIGNDFIEVAATGKSPIFVYDLVKTLTQVFIDESLRREVGGIRGALEFSSEQLTIYKKKLDESEERLRKFQEGMLQDQLEDEVVITANMNQVRNMLTTTEFELREANDRLHFLNRRINELGLNYGTPNNNVINTYKAQLLNAFVELSKLMLHYSWQDVKVLKINSLIKKLQENIRQETEKEIKAKYSIVDASKLEIIFQKETTAMEVEFLKRKKNTFAELINYFGSKLSQGPSKEMTLNRIQREVEENRGINQTLLQETRCTELEEALQKTEAEFKFKIIEPAIKPVTPIAPKRLRINFMAILIGMASGFGLISLIELMDHSFKNVEAVEKYLSLPVLGTVPLINMDVDHKNRGK